MKQKLGQSAKADGEIENRNPNDMHGERVEYNGGRIQTGAPDFVRVASIHPNILRLSKKQSLKVPSLARCWTLSLGGFEELVIVVN